MSNHAGLPNILITGTPGTGKTSLCERVAEELGMVHVNVGALVKEQGLHEGRDDEFDAFILDEDKVLSCALFPSVFLAHFFLCMKQGI